MAPASLGRVTAPLRRAAALRTLARRPNLSARQPAGWEEEEDGPWDAGYVDGEDG